MKSFNNSYLHHVITTCVEFGERGSCPIDQTPAQSFNIDPHTGRPMSDIQRLVHIQNDLQLASEFAQLKEFAAKYLPKDMSDADAIKFAVPRLCQLPSEIVEFRVNQAKQLVERQKFEQEKKLAIETAKKQSEMFDAFMKKTPKSD